MFLLMKKEVDGEIWLKTALRNKKTGKIYAYNTTLKKAKRQIKLLYSLEK